MRDIYSAFLRCHHLLPDEVGRQNPWVLFRLLDALEQDADLPEEEYSNGHLRMFYGEEV